MKIVFAFQLLVLISGPLKAQIAYTYEYDNTGNRISRNAIYLQTARTPGNTAIPDSLSASVANQVLPDNENRITDTIGSASIELYPNPIREEVTILFSESHSIFDEIRVYDGHGKIIYQGTKVKSPANLNFYNFKPGSYTILISMHGILKRYTVIKK